MIASWLKIRWVYHTLTWFGGILLISLMATFTNEDLSLFEALSELAVYFSGLVIPVYLIFYFKERFYANRQYLAFALSGIFSIGVGVLLYRGIYLIVPHLEQKLVQDINNLFFFLLVALGIQYFKRGVVSEYQLQELRAKTAQLELQALRTQINPHFLFNTLNNIYIVNKKDPENGSEMILGLADVMRYHLHSSDRKTVSMEEELELITAYVELEKLRIRENCTVELNIDDQLNPNLKVASLVFLPFIENAFKFGTHPQRESFVIMDFTSRENTIFFKVSNSVFPNKKVVKTGLGMENTKRRLQLIYGDQHQLAIQHDDNTWTVELKIDL